MRRMYVVGKDVVSRIVYVASGRDHPALFTASAQLRAPSWIAGRPPDGLNQVCHLPPERHLPSSALRIDRRADQAIGIIDRRADQIDR